LRVIAGELGGRRLHAPRGSRIRPTSDRLREALFSILGDVGGEDVLDLFSGTGALGIEALSRGARRAVFVDTEMASTRRNVEGLGLAERAHLVEGDVLAYLRKETADFGLILCDPPYRLAARLARPLEELVRERLRSGGRLVVESPAREPLTLNMELMTDRTYGEASLRIWGAR
jgi:16S rRNA (guanine966-N2)-methyltransferase